MYKATFRDFFKLEAAGGILLLVAAALAMVMKNSPFGEIYEAFLDTPIQIRVGPLEIDKPLLLWVNDGLMAVFFFMIGMEVKREVLVGELSDLRQIILPVFAGLGGIIVPAAVFIVVVGGDPTIVRGWAVPTATDIAFALGILALAGPAVPTSLKLFLMTLAIIDDLGAIVIIALFYSSNLSPISLLVALVAITVLAMLAIRGEQRITPYILIGLVLWLAVLKSGVHATLAGVVLGFFIPLGPRDMVDDDKSPLKHAIHVIHPWAAYAILPLFAFANAGVVLRGISIGDLLQGVPLAIALGLFIGKQVGVFGFAWLAIKTKCSSLPAQVNWGQLYGVAILTGVGFTMSLFIGSLAYPDSYVLDSTRPYRLGVIAGSLLSGVVGFVVLRIFTPASGESETYNDNARAAG
jgi:NhaA family Na+:H+ antiporter